MIIIYFFFSLILHFGTICIEFCLVACASACHPLVTSSLDIVVLAHFTSGRTEQVCVSPLDGACNVRMAELSTKLAICSIWARINPIALTVHLLAAFRFRYLFGCCLFADRA